jgi:hypothetical protein
MSVIDGDKPDHHDDDPDDTPPPRGGRPALRREVIRGRPSGLFCYLRRHL